MAGKYFGIPFALSGDRSAIPDAAQPDGSVSFTQGFTLDYELENTDPDYKPVPREETNALYYDITEAIGIVQKQGFADWTIAAAPYPINAFVRHNDIVWRNSIAGNSAEPGTDVTWLNTSAPTSILPTGYFSGFSLANDGAAPNTTISVAAGSARSSDNTVDINLANSLRGILQSSGAWAAGDNQNKLDTGAKANSTTYHVFAIRNTIDGIADILFSLSATAPTMPAGYSGFRRIGRIVTDSSGNIRRFFNRGGGYYDWLDPIVEVTASGVANGSALLALTGLGGAPVHAVVNFIVSGDGVAFRALPSDVTNSAINSTVTTYTGGVVGETSAGSDTGAGVARVVTDTSSQIRIAFRTTVGNVSYRLLTLGYQEIL